MRDNISDILEAVEENLPRTNSMLAKGLKPFPVSRAVGFVAEAVYRLRDRESGYESATMGVVVRRVEHGTEVLLKVGTIWDES